MKENATDVHVEVGHGLAPNAATYVADRLRELVELAHRPVESMSATVTLVTHRAAQREVGVRAALAVGHRTVRAEGAGTNLRAAVDLVSDRLRRQLADLPHGRRGDYVPHHTAAGD